MSASDEKVSIFITSSLKKVFYDEIKQNIIIRSKIGFTSDEL